MLPALLDKVIEFKKVNARYPLNWVELNYKIACGEAVELLPPSKNHAWWRPNNCKLNYGFATKEYKEFILIAKDSSGQIKFGIGLNKQVVKIKSRTNNDLF